MEHKSYRVQKRLRLLKTPEFDEWFEAQTEKTKVKVDGRLDRIALEGYFGWVKKFGPITELKWTSNLRVYLHETKTEVVIVLLGGNKGGQEKDIKKAKKILQEFEGI